MSSLPRVTAVTRERIARELDARGPETVRTEAERDLKLNNPELFDIAARCARDVGNPTRVMGHFYIFYRLLAAEAQAALGTLPESERLQLSLLPRVSGATRSSIVERIDAEGSHRFTRDAVAALERENPELLIAANSFAEGHPDYMGLMAGFALLYACLCAEAAQLRASLH